MRTLRIRFLTTSCKVILALAVMTMPCLAQVDALTEPTGKVLLTISGKIENTNVDERAEFDFEMLSALGLTSIKTATPWTSADTEFKGVLTKKLLEAVGAFGTTIKATALNDYTIELPIEDYSDFNTLLATHLNGERMSVRNKGPIWVIYPNDDQPDVPGLVLENRMIWQLKTIEIL